MTIALLALSLLGCENKTKGQNQSSPPPKTATNDVISQGSAMTTKAAPPAPADLASLARSSNAFGFDLWSRVRIAPGNLAISPASISAALAMTWGGSRGKTSTEMKQVMHLDGDVDAVMTGWGHLATALQAPGRPLTLRIANRLFGEKSATFEAAYLDKTRAAFGAGLEPLDFAGSPEPARAHINGWVEQQTESRIKDLLPSGSIDNRTRLVLVNAIYFLASWHTPFPPRRTTPQPFSLAGGTTQQVPMMSVRHPFGHAKVDGVAVLKMPYSGGALSMIVVLPDDVDGLARTEASLDAARLATWITALKTKDVLVSLPRFEIDPASALQLSSHLQPMGMQQAFARDADFTGIANPPNPADRVFIGEVFHKAFVKVDEKGTEAAAATAVGIPGGGPPPKALEFTADHPFLFFIVDDASGLILFMGRVATPPAA